MDEVEGELGVEMGASGVEEEKRDEEGEVGRGRDRDGGGGAGFLERES